MRSPEVQRLVDAVEERYGPVELYGSSPEEEHGTCFIVAGVPATFSVITLDGTLPPDTFDVQVEGIPPGDYVYVTTVSSAGLLRLVERLGGPPDQWPLMTDWVELLARFPVEPQPPCPEEALLDAEERLGLSLPDDLRGLLGHSNGLFDRAGQWYFVWPLERIVAANLALQAEAEGGFPTGLVAFGDDGTGAPFCIATSRDQPICRWSPIDAQVQMLASNLDSFLDGWLSGTTTT